MLDQHKEKTPKDLTIRAKFNSYRFADNERVAGATGTAGLNRETERL